VVAVSRPPTRILTDARRRPYRLLADDEAEPSS
jgi:hypothetical protein